jgi:nucleotide-binding universal stress UspA family protein
MSGIVCAIRGGSASRPTIEKSIQLAADTGLTLYFLYVVNLDFLSHTASSRTHFISKELDAMGDFILLNAQRGAESQGITSEGVVRHGQVDDEIINLCKEISADYVVLGRPQEQGEENIFTHERLSSFAQRIEDETGTKIVLTAGD